MHTKRITIHHNDHVFVLTGAGVSAESGLATFRGSDGLWEGERVEDVASPHGWKRDPERVWRFYSLRRKAAAKAEPNPAHEVLAKLERELGKRFFLCTQNVDNLHERAGSRNLVHMHGELFESCCDSCTRESYPDAKLYESEAEHDFCGCGGRIRPNIVWFGEVPFHMERIFEELNRCTMMLVIGTSGVVQPAASFVHWANQRYSSGGAPVRTYYIGPEHPANAGAFTKVFEGKAGEVLPKLFP
ncbi:MAG TPA: NAD-dependent deacylase [Candidatus Saccharimonadales bacterium]|nr:NAD-dependent deacylase [Candidatus Saccharimonadales bacterium]